MLRPQNLSRLRSILSTKIPQASQSIRLASTHFGFETVDEKEKEKKVAQVFDNVATKYDLMNDVMSFGIHRIWKDYYVDTLKFRPNCKVLDVAGGTGDIAFRLQRKINNSGKITVFDINQNMLDVGKRKAVENEKVDASKLEWVQGDAENLPFPEGTFDLYTISFGIRNCTHVDKVLKEAFRVLKSGGQLAVLEFSEVPDMLKPVYDAYSFNVIPVMGQVVAGDYHSYKYLVESIRKFPNQEEFANMFREAGFENVRYENLSFGICAIHKGWKK